MCGGGVWGFIRGRTEAQCVGGGGGGSGASSTPPPPHINLVPHKHTYFKPARVGYSGTKEKGVQKSEVQKKCNVKCRHNGQ